MTAGAPFVVPDALKKDLRPRRSIAGSAARLTASAATKQLAKIAKEYSKKTRFGEEKSYAQIFERGLATKDEPELGERRAAAHALMLDLTVDAVRAADIEVLAMAEHIVSSLTRDSGLFGPIAALRGTEDAVRVAMRSTFYLKTAASAGWTTAIWLISGGPLDHRALDIARWLAVRNAVCAASDEDYGALVEIARSLREDLDLVRRAHLAFAFPDEPWGNDDLAASQQEDADEPTHRFSFDVLLSATDRAELAREQIRRSGAHTVATYGLDLAYALAPDDAIAIFVEALPALLKKPAYGPVLKTPPRKIAELLACYKTPAAAEALTPYGANAVLAPIVLGYFRDAPELAGQVDKETKGSAAVSRVVARKVVSSDAETGETPSILRDRPWRVSKAGKSTKSAPAAISTTLLGLDEETVLSDDRIEPDDARDMTADELATWKAATTAALANDRYAVADYELLSAPPGWEYLRVPAEECIWAFNEGAYLRGAPLALVRRHGLAVLPGFERRRWIKWLGASEDQGEYFFAVMALISPRTAPMIASVAARRKKYRRLAHAWLVQHARISAFGLIPAAVGVAGEARDEAEAALLFIARREQAAVVREVAALYGDDAARIIEALLARDPLSLGVTPPKPPAFLRVDELPAVVLRSGGILDVAGREALVEMLQVAPLDPPYAGIELVRAACEEPSLGAFALELVEQWILGDAPGRHEWMLFSVLHFPSEAGTRRVASIAREWARKDQAKALRACIVLAAMASDVALLHLGHIADTTRFDALRKETEALLVEAADARELSLDELGDRTVPDLGLDADGALRLSVGARRFLVTLDETLSPRVIEELEDGSRSAPEKSLPRASKSDGDEAKAARTRFDMLKKDLGAVADRERRRLERAMISGRTWSAADFRTRIVAHPLLVHLARRLVWIAGGAMFRVAEDRSFADVDDRVFELAGDALVRIAHPARDAALLDAWPRVFGDYEIVQPFEQLGRAVHAIEAADRAMSELARLAGIRAPARKILGVLESRGFRRESAGLVGTFLREARAEDGRTVTLRLPLDPQVEMDLLDDAEATTVAPSIVDRRGEALAFGALDAASFSELVRDVEALRDLAG